MTKKHCNNHKPISEDDLSEIIKLRINEIIKKLYDLNDFIVSIIENKFVNIVRISDNKDLLIPYCDIKKKCIIDKCGKWIATLKKLIINEFGYTNENTELIEKINELSQKIDCIYNKICPDEDFSGLDSWIVTFKPNFDPENCGLPGCVKIKYVYSEAFNGMNCYATYGDMFLLKEKHPEIESFECDHEVKITALNERTVGILAAQPAGSFINRIGANGSSQRSGDGVGTLAAKTNINVFVVDTGISAHPDLNIVSGINFTSTIRTAWTDGNGHGTHVSGIIGALDNSFGIVGVAPGIRLWAVKVLSDNGSGSTSNIIAALDWILQKRNVLWAGIGIVNMSLGGGVNTALDNAVNKLLNNGIVVVVAAGNSSIDAANFSPARTPNAITVGATSPIPLYNTLASFSNYGSLVDILAPGTSITSTYLANGYASLSGTSMAAPVVTGTVALMLSGQTIAGGNTITFVNNVRNKLVTVSSNLIPKYFNGTNGANPRIVIPPTKPTTNISVWAGSY